MRQEAGNSKSAYSNNKMLLANQHQCFHTSDGNNKQIYWGFPGSSQITYLYLLFYKTWQAIYCLCVESGILRQVVGIINVMWEF